MIGELVLASTSPYRRSQLERLGVPFRCRAPVVDEESLKSRCHGLGPEELARFLADAKSTRAKEEPEEVVVIGGDQLVVFEDRILGKPGTESAAVAMLESLAGREHRLVTALAVRHRGGIARRTDVARLRLRPLEREEFVRYVAADRPLDCAGAYKLEARGIVLFESVETSDPSAIQGLPLIALASVLRELGFPLP